MSEYRRFTRLITSSPLIARTTVEEVHATELELQVVGDPGRFRLHLRGVEGVAVSSALVLTRGDVDLASSPWRTSYLLVHVLGGDCWIERDGEQVLVAAGGVTISAPDEQLALRLRGQGIVRIVRIQPRLMGRVFAAMAGFLPARPIRFDSATTRDGDFLDVWAREVEHLLKTLEDGTQACDIKVLHHVEMAFVEALLRYPCHEFHHRIRSDALPPLREVSPNALAAADFVAVLIRAEPWREISMAHYARMANLTANELGNAFRWQLGMAPAQYRRVVQLDCVHEDLRRADLEWASIAEIARRWRLPSSSRFHRWYHDRFGEWPSQTRWWARR